MSVTLKPGEEVEIIAEFSVRKDAPDGETDIINFHFDSKSSLPVPISHYQLTALIKADKTKLEVECNSAVDSGGDAGGGAIVDLGGFVGKAGFSWQMYRIKDEMKITVAGIEKTTGCVSGKGTFEMDIPPGATTASVVVIPNCDKTHGTQWNFRFECPLTSTVTSDGQGNTLPSSDRNTSGQADGTGNNGGVGSAAGTSDGKNTGSGLASPFSGLTGSTIGTVKPMPQAGASTDVEPNNNIALATLVPPSTTISGSIEKAGDADYFSMSTKAPGVWELIIKPAASAQLLDLGVHPAGGGNWLPDRSPKGDSKLVVDIKWPGKYVLRVTGKQGLAPGAPYQVVASFRPSPDKYEPNDSTGSAPAINPNATLVGAIMPAGDADYYLADFNRAGEWTIAIAAKPDNLAPVLGVHPAGGGNWLPDRSPKNDNKLVVDIKWPGKYVLRVTDNNQSRSIDPYVIKLQYKPSPDRSEPNDNAGTAQPVSVNDDIIGTILPTGDADYYSAHFPKQGEWSITIVEKPGKLQLGLGVHPAGGGNWLPDRSTKGDNKLVVDIKWPGEYVLRVIDNNGSRSIDPYKLKLEYKPSPENSEPNDNVGTAKHIDPNSVVIGTILPAGDADYQLVDIPKHGRWTIAIEQTPPGMALGLGVHPAGGGNWIPDRSAKGDNKLVVDLRWPGQYVLRVIDNNKQRSAAPYRLRLDFVNSPDDYEPNNTVATAHEIYKNSKIIGTILPPGDADYYEIDAKSPGEWVVDLISSPGEIKPGLGVHPSGGGNWLPDNSPKGDNRLITDIKWPGRYVLRVIDNNGSSSVNPYELRSLFTQAPDLYEPNDSTGIAAAIPAEGTIVGAILPRGDADYFIADFPRKGMWSISVDEQPNAMKIGLGVHSAAGGNWLRDESPKGDGQLVVNIPAAGKYILRAIDVNGGRSIQRYRLKLRFE